jgi:hypothetical protein
MQCCCAWPRRCRAAIIAGRESDETGPAPGTCKGRRPQSFGGRTVRRASDGVGYFLAARTLRMPVPVISDPLKSRFAFAVHPIGAVC